MSDLIDLQKRQLEHDKNHHRDIYTLPYPERMNHYVLHFSKYVARLSRDYPDDEMLENQIQKTLADSFIVALAGANTLNIDAEQELEEMFGLEASGLAEWASELNPSDDEMRLEELQEWWFYRMASPTGRMANALESLDHMESVNVRQILEEELMEILSILIMASDHIDKELESLLDDRWAEIEDNSIL